MSKVLGTMSQNTSHNHEHSSWLAYILPNNIPDFTNEKMKRIVTQSRYNKQPLLNKLIHRGVVHLIPVNGMSTW